ncbi:unnamed protein product [Echinostoma caproni]|uniref:Transposase n=1 Tax=Echinostoma caproni TaxID=27848 RepID=A0A183BAH2_9TREM|nr:unnamed protein product [Echinostoma caproni]
MTRRSGNLEVTGFNLLNGQEDVAAEVATDPERSPSRQPGANKAALKGSPIVEAYAGERHADDATTWTQIGIRLQETGQPGKLQPPSWALN